MKTPGPESVWADTRNTSACVPAGTRVLVPESRWPLAVVGSAPIGSMSETFSFARCVCEPTPGSYAAIKRTLNEHDYANFDELLELEAVLQQERAESSDFVEGVLAFVQKRPAKFTGD